MNISAIVSELFMNLNCKYTMLEKKKILKTKKLFPKVI